MNPSDDPVLLSAVPLTASFGVATFPLDANSKLELIRAAYTAMYDAKHAGGDTIRGFAGNCTQFKSDNLAEINLT
jgi:GGDEF domain-containing protein